MNFKLGAMAEKLREAFRGEGLLFATTSWNDEREKEILIELRSPSGEDRGSPVLTEGERDGEPGFLFVCAPLGVETWSEWLREDEDLEVLAKDYIMDEPWVHDGAAAMSHTINKMRGLFKELVGGEIVSIGSRVHPDGTHYGEISSDRVSLYLGYQMSNGSPGFQISSDPDPRKMIERFWFPAGSPGAMGETVSWFCRKTIAQQTSSK